MLVNSLECWHFAFVFLTNLKINKPLKVDNPAQHSNEVWRRNRGVQARLDGMAIEEPQNLLPNHLAGCTEA